MNAAWPALEWRELQPTDLDAMDALHRLSIAGMAPEAVKRESTAYFASVLGAHGGPARGRVCGAWQHGMLVAYGVLQHDMLPHDDPRPVLGLPAHQCLRKLAGASVHPHWRGQQLQQRLIRTRVAWASGAVCYVTAAPCNLPSWHNLLACGFEVRALHTLAGAPRYLLAHGLPAPPAPCQAACESGLAQLERQRELLAQGWRGVAVGSAPDRLRLLPPAAGGA